MADTTIPWVIIRLGKRTLGVPSINVMEMLVLPDVASIPNAPDYVRGVITLRDTVIPIMDFRRRLGMDPASKEVDALINLLEEREQDHVNWLNELKASVEQGTEFKLARDPHKCKFGQWYDTYKPSNLTMENHLKKFDEPHRMIHALADKVLERAATGDRQSALEMIQNAENTVLSLLKNLFREARNLLRETLREIVIVLRHDERLLGVTVDNIESVENLNEDTVEPLPGVAGIGGHNEIVTKTGRTARQDNLVMLVDVPALFTSDKHTKALLEQVEQAMPAGAQAE